MRKTILSLTLATTVISGCTIDMSGENDAETVDSVKVVTPTTTAPSPATDRIDQLLNSYFDLKNALVKSDSVEAQQRAQSFGSAVASIGSALIAGEQTELAKYQTSLKTYADKVSNSTSLNVQREAFSQLSLSLYELIKYFGSGKPVYHDYCPMALNDKGAMWLSETEEIKNPYFGDEMMECGSVEEVIKR